MVAEPGTTLVAVASRNRAKAERFAERFGCEAVVGYQTLLDRSDIDAVYIPLPAMLHGEWIERSLLAGVHVLAEKPLTTDRRLTQRLVQLAKARDLLLMENFMFLQHSQHAEVRRLLSQGVIGEIRSFTSAFTIPPKPAEDIRYQPDIGGGALWDVGVYPLRASLHFLGAGLEVVGALLRHARQPDVVVSGSILLSTPAGVSAQLAFGMEHSYRTDYEFCGSDGRLSLDRVFTPPDSHQPVVRIEWQDHREELVLPADRQFAKVIATFVQAVAAGTDTVPSTDSSVQLAALIEQVDTVARHTYGG
ncbi:Gfo/Idh/MocA family protein [Kitasatospora sp. NPDC001119]